jgi:hypothetical protein
VCRRARVAQFGCMCEDTRAHKKRSHFRF